MNIFTRKYMMFIMATVIFIATSVTANAQSMGGAMDMPDTDRYGGQTYTGPPNLAVTVAFVQAGGGPSNFSFKKALVSMAGSGLITTEVAKLTNQFGAAKVNQWLATWDFAVADALRQVQGAGITLPPAAPLEGPALASTLVMAGVTNGGPDTGAYWTGHMLDVAISHKFHNQTMDDIDAKYGEEADAEYHQMY